MEILMTDVMKKKFCYFCGNKLTTKSIEDQLRLYCNKCNCPIYENPVPATTAIVINNQGKLLLVKRGVPPNIGSWCLPGGFMELEETPEECILREIKEETGLCGKIETLIGITQTNNTFYNSVLILCYLIKNYKGILVAGSDSIDAAFFPFTDLPKIKFSSHKNFIRIYKTAYGSD
jgi:ADP-ribose pyrophosphatase YjhB (NUDIX family)